MRTKFLVIDYGNDVHRVPIYEGEARPKERARKNTIRRMRKIWLERANKRTNIERRKEKGTEQTHFRISCSVDGVAAFSRCSRNDDDDDDVDEERRERRGVEAMQRKRRDDEKEVDDERRKEGRRQNGISNWMVSILIPYSDAHSINIQLHRDHVSLSILLPFLILPRCTRTV